MTQRLAIMLLAPACLVLSGYLVAASLILGLGEEREGEEAAGTYVEEYHRWLSENPGSGWARVEALAAGPELARIERLRGEMPDRSGWRYAGGDFHLLLQAGGKGLVEGASRVDGRGGGVGRGGQSRSQSVLAWAALAVAFGVVSLHWFLVASPQRQVDLAQLDLPYLPWYIAQQPTVGTRELGAFYAVGTALPGRTPAP